MNRWISVPIFAMLAGLMIPGGANAETVGTACVSKSGNISKFAPYRSTPRKKCSNRQQVVRLSLDQATTGIAKRRATIKPPSGAITLVDRSVEEDWSINLSFGGNTEGNGCVIEIIDELDDYTYIIADVPRGSWQQGIREVVVIDLLDDDVESYETDNMVLVGSGVTGGNFALFFHDVFIENRSGECFGAVFVEWADDPRTFYAE